MRAILAVLVVVGAVRQQAEACSCSRGDFLTAGDVPLNVRIPVLGFTGVVPELVSEAGVVPTTLVQVPGAAMLVPNGPLAANTDYVINPDIGTFRTGVTVDEVAPLTPTLGAVSHSVSPALFRSTCDLGGETFVITVAGSEPAPLSVFEVFTGPTIGSIDTSTPSLTVSTAFGMIVLSDSSLCEQVRGSTFPVSATPSLAVQIRQVDAAGNASEFSNALQLKPAAGCSSTAFGPLAVLAALVASRRRRGR